MGIVWLQKIKWKFDKYFNLCNIKIIQAEQNKFG